MEADVLSTVQRLARHLRLRPNVFDTPEGIVRWWLADETPVMVVEAALAWMVSRGAVECVHAADGRTRYRRAPDADGDARLDALAADPRVVPPQTPPGPAPGLLH